MAKKYEVVMPASDSAAKAVVDAAVGGEAQPENTSTAAEPQEASAPVAEPKEAPVEPKRNMEVWQCRVPHYVLRTPFPRIGVDGVVVRDRTGKPRSMMLWAGDHEGRIILDLDTELGKKISAWMRAQPIAGVDFWRVEEAQPDEKTDAGGRMVERLMTLRDDQIFAILSEEEKEATGIPKDCRDRYLYIEKIIKLGKRFVV